jgi:hypothetical protein
MLEKNRRITSRKNVREKEEIIIYKNVREKEENKF